MALIVPTLHVVNKLTVANLFKVKEVSVPILRNLLGKVSRLCETVEDQYIPLNDFATNLKDGYLKTYEDFEYYVVSSSDADTFLDLFNGFMRPDDMDEIEVVNEHLFTVIYANIDHIAQKADALQLRLALYTRQAAILLSLVDLLEKKASRKHFIQVMYAHGIDLSECIDE